MDRAFHDKVLRTVPLTRIDRALLDEAQWILPRVLRVKRPFAPGPNYDAAARRVMDAFTRETLKRSGSLVNRIEVIHREVERFCRAVRLAHR